MNYNPFAQLPDPSHKGEIFTPREYIEQVRDILERFYSTPLNESDESANDRQVKPVKPKLYDPTAGLGQFEVVLHDYDIIATDLYESNIQFARQTTTSDNTSDIAFHCIDAFKERVNDRIVVSNPPYECYMKFIEHTFLNNPTVPAAIFIIPCKWMSEPRSVKILRPYIRFIQFIDSSKFILRSSVWHKNKNGIACRIVSDTCILVLDRVRTVPTMRTVPDNWFDAACDLPIIPCPLVKPIHDTVDTVDTVDTFNPYNRVCQFVQLFVNRTREIGSVKQRFISQYHYFKHTEHGTVKQCEKSHSPLPDNAIILTSRRQRIAHKSITRSQFRNNTHIADWKCILNTSNECQNGFVRPFPVYLCEPYTVFTASFCGFYGTREEMEVLHDLLDSRAFQTLLALIKRTQNFNSHFFYAIPCILSRKQLNEFMEQLKPWSDMIDSMPNYTRRAYNCANLPTK